VNPFLKSIIINTTLRSKKRNGKEKYVFTEYELAKGFHELKISIKREITDWFLILIGISSATFGLRSFILPNNFIDGGAMGISLLLAELTPFSISMLVIFVNLPFMFMAVKQIGNVFAVRTTIAITMLALSLAFVSTPDMTHDKLLVAVFGGFFLGAGIGFSVRGGAVIDGTEVLAIFLSRKIGATIGDIIFIINIIIFSAAAYLLSVETALYSILTYLAASKTIDFIIEGIEEYMGVTIISVKHEEIRQMIIEKLGRGVTIYKGKGGYGKTGIKARDMDVLYTVITRLEIARMQSEIEKIDANAFVVMTSVKDTKGGMIKKRPLHE
jgi:uncharacterized membrane-anchored protein YitT (DUF2179 family)